MRANRVLQRYSLANAAQIPKYCSVVVIDDVIPRLTPLLPFSSLPLPTFSISPLLISPLPFLFSLLCLPLPVLV